MYFNLKYYLEQSRRDKTREALITPHKRGAVWGWMPKRVSDCGNSDDVRAKRSVCVKQKQTNK